MKKMILIITAFFIVLSACGQSKFTTDQLVADSLSINGTNWINEFSTDGLLGGNSDKVLPTEKAVKTYVDTHAGGVALGDSSAVPKEHSYATGKMLSLKAPQTAIDTLTGDNELTNRLALKQATLVSATNIKTINSTSLLGSGNITIGGTETLWIADSAQVVHMADTAGVTGNNKIATKANVALKLNNSDTSTMLSTYARKLSPTLTGTPLTPTAAAGTNTTQIASTAYSFAAAQKAAGDTATARLNGAGELNTLAKMLADTITLFVAGKGDGTIADTAAMKNGMSGGDFFWAADSFKVADVKSRVGAGSGTEALTFNMFWGTSYGTATDSLFTSATAVNSHTGESDVPNKNTTIHPRNWVWCVYRGAVAGNLPSMVRSTIIGYIKRD
jgi:hypothetical protein